MIQERAQLVDGETDLDLLLGMIDREVAGILERVLEHREVSREEGTRLFETRGYDLQAVLATADLVRREDVGDRVSFVVNRNINFTNVCHMGCRFCNFRRRIDSNDAELLSTGDIVRRAREAWARGATEVCIQGGLHPGIKGTHYREIVKALHAALPALHLHAFSPFEIWYGSKLSRLAPEAFLADLKACGLGTLPGTAAEILDTEVRRHLTENKLSAGEWVRIIKAAHAVGLRSSATIMYGHVDGPRHWAAHIALLREIQKATGGFTEFVPLGFIHYDSPLHLHFGARPGPTWAEHLRMHAVARLMLRGCIDNIQASWVKLGPGRAQEMLRCGANDLGGTLMNESISRAAGARYGQEITPLEMVRLIRNAGRTPVRRNTFYEVVETFANRDPIERPPLVARDETNTRRLAALTYTRREKDHA